MTFRYALLRGFLMVVAKLQTQLEIAQ